MFSAQGRHWPLSSIHVSDLYRSTRVSAYFSANDVLPRYIGALPANRVWKTSSGFSNSLQMEDHPPLDQLVLNVRIVPEAADFSISSMAPKISSNLSRWLLIRASPHSTLDLACEDGAPRHLQHPPGNRGTPEALESRQRAGAGWFQDRS